MYPTLMNVAGGVCDPQLAVHDHGHEHVSSRRVVVALTITVIAALMELGGAAVGSTLFLVADACHLLAHVGIFFVLLIPAGPEHGRREDLATSVILGLIVLIALGIAWSAWRRIDGGSSEPVTPSLMLLSILGLAANLTTAWLFADPARTRWSFRAALAHELADGALTVVGIAGAGFIAAFGWMWVDPALSATIAGWLVGWSGRLLVKRLRHGPGVWALQLRG